MSKFKLKFVLVLFKGLIGLKRALTFLFFGLGMFLEKLGRFLILYLIFPVYKTYSAIFLRLRQWSGQRLGRRQILYLLIFLVVFILALSESSAYASNQYLSGRYSLLYNYLGPGEEGEIFEEGMEDSTRIPFAASWEQGFLVPLAPRRDVGEEGLEELTGSTFGETAFLQPLIMPGADIGAGRQEIIKYAVQPGDTVGGLAQKFRISVETILIENKLSVTSLLRPGDSLTILPISGVSHRVKKGDTVKKIAALYRADTQKIIDFNHLAEDQPLLVSEILVIPEGRQPYVPVIPRQPVAARPPASQVSRAGLLWPTVGRRISQYFKWRHAGIDIAQPTGTPIYAADAGVVEIAGWNRGGYGYQIMINHGNNLKTRYAHNSKNFVVAGQRVEKGEVIALIGSTGRSTGPHLHFEIMVGGVRVNPFIYVR